MSGVKKQKKEVKEVLVGSYTPKNIMVTGGAGFIASHVVIQLVKQFPEYKVVCFDKLDYCSSLKNLNEVKDCPNFKFIKGNLLSADLIKYVLETECIDTIIHAAAQTHVDNSFGNSFAFTENNVMGSHVLVEAAKVHGIKRFIHVSTDEVYGSLPPGAAPVPEKAAYAPGNPYSATKAAVARKLIWKPGSIALSGRATSTQIAAMARPRMEIALRFNKIAPKAIPDIMKARTAGASDPVNTQ
jgi:UDP-glucose 4,6-dehydratase